MPRPSEAFAVTDRVEVWTVQTDDPALAARMPSFESLLTSDEAARAGRFLQSADRDRFVIGRALARTMLSRFAPQPPKQWVFVIDERGRPHLASEHASGNLRFNLTHTDGLVACAVTVGREVGVDVERVTRRLTHEHIPERFFSPREVRDLRALPEVEQDAAFFDYWTLKESYIKARGLGLALPLGQFSFVRTPDAAPGIEFAPELDDDPASWQFRQYWPTPQHRMAVAVRRSGHDLPVTVRSTLPEVAD